MQTTQPAPSSQEPPAGAKPSKLATRMAAKGFEVGKMEGPCEVALKYVDRIRKGEFKLSPEHREHFIKEWGLGSEWLVDALNAEGWLATLPAKDARNLSIRRKGLTLSDDVSFLLMNPASGYFQVRLSENLVDGDGKKVRYLNPVGAHHESFSTRQLPEGILEAIGETAKGTTLLTEGWKDAIASLLHGRTHCVCVPGVSSVRKSVQPKEKQTLVFDADGRTNPAVFLQLFKGGLHTDGMVRFLPEIPGQPKGGLCEFFAWKREQGVDPIAAFAEEVVDEAKLPLNLLVEWIEGWGYELFTTTERDAHERAYMACLQEKAATDETFNAKSYLDTMATVTGRDRTALGKAFSKQKDRERTRQVEDSGFETSAEEGLTYFEIGPKGHKVLQVGGHLRAIARTADPQGDQFGVLVQFEAVNKYGRKYLREWLMKRSMLGDPTHVVSRLADMGYYVRHTGRAALIQYLSLLGHPDHGEPIDAYYTISDRVGWHAGESIDGEDVSEFKSFLLPNSSYGDDSLRWKEVQSTPAHRKFLKKGTLESWQQEIGRLCVGNSRLTLIAGAALAGPLMRLLGVDSGAFHIQGKSGSGKTTALDIATSITGDRKYGSWNASPSGLEAEAADHNDGILCLDELGQTTPESAAAIAYLLANGQGKLRMDGRTMGSRPVTEWKAMVLSTGEMTMEDFLASGGLTIRGGQEARFPTIPAVPQGDLGLGAFEEIHGFGSPAEFADHVKYTAAKHKGVVLPLFIEKLVGELHADDNEEGWTSVYAERLKEKAMALTALSSVSDQGGVLNRVARRFALVGVALDLAEKWGLMPWARGQGWEAVKTCFGDWLKARGGGGNIEISRALKRISALISASGSRFSNLADGLNGGAPIQKRLGFYNEVEMDGTQTEYWMTPSLFSAEIIGDCTDRKGLLSKMIEMGWLIPDAKGNAYNSRRFLGTTGKVYILDPSKISEYDGYGDCPTPIAPPSAPTQPTQPTATDLGREAEAKRQTAEAKVKAMAGEMEESAKDVDDETLRRSIAGFCDKQFKRYLPHFSDAFKARVAETGSRPFPALSLEEQSAAWVTFSMGTRAQLRTKFPQAIEAVVSYTKRG